MKKVNVYLFDELSEDAKANAIERERRFIQRDSDYPWLDETFESMKATIEAAGIKLKDWSLAPYSCGSYIKLEFPEIYNYGDCFKINGDYAEELTGKRAYAWLENNLFSHLRISFKGRRRWDDFKYGEDYRPGHIPPGPFTGCLYDNDFISSLLDSVKNGENIYDAFHGLVQTCNHIARQEIEYVESDEGISDKLSNSDMYFTENGNFYGFV